MLLLKLGVLASVLATLKGSEHCDLLGRDPYTSSYYGSGSLSGRFLPKHVLCRHVTADSILDLNKEIEPLLKQNLVRYVQINGSFIPVLSRGMFKFLQKVPGLRVNEANVEIVEAGAFNGTFLQLLDLSHNVLTVLKDDYFGGLPNLTSLDLSYNSIVLIKNGAFRGLDVLTKLDLQHNFLLRLDSRVFEGVRVITTLILSANNLQELDVNLFKNLSNLETLSLGKNQLESLGKNIFDQNLQLETLDVNGNFLLTLDFILPNSCATINANDNNLTEVNWTNLAAVCVLNLNNNAIKSLESSPNQSKIRELYLDNNYLRKLVRGAFDEFVNLEVLSLGGNKLDVVAQSMFSNNNRLRSLSLANNSLSTLDVSRFPASLKELNLSANNFCLLPNLSTFNQLELLDASFNNINELTTDMFAKLKNLRTLALQNNEIARIRLGSFRDLNALFELNLSNNNISVLEIGVFAGLSSLSGLDVSHNQLTTLNEGVFHSFKSLRYLSFAYNKINYFNAKNTLAHFYWMTVVDLAGNDWPCSLLADLIRGIRNIKLKEGGASNVTNINGIACRVEKEEAVAGANTQNLVNINNKLTAINAILILIFVVLVAKFASKCLPRGLVGQTLTRHRSEQEMQLISS